MQQPFRLIFCWALFEYSNAFLPPVTFQNLKYDRIHRTLGFVSATNSLYSTMPREDFSTTSHQPTYGIPPLISPSNRLPHYCRKSRSKFLQMSALGPIGPFSPFKSNYCSSGIVEKEMASLTSLAEALSTKFSRIMLGFQVVFILIMDDRID